jgi:hypothetical protein
LAGARIPYHLERIMQMVDIYGKIEVLAALEKACEHGAYHYEYIDNIIQQRRRAEESATAALRPGIKHGREIRLQDIDMSQYHLNTENDNE